MVGAAAARRGPGLLFYIMVLQLGSQITRQDEKPPVTRLPTAALRPPCLHAPH